MPAYTVNKACASGVKSIALGYQEIVVGNSESDPTKGSAVARSLIEKTRGDLFIAFAQRSMHDALERHARDVLGGEG